MNQALIAALQEIADHGKYTPAGSLPDCMAQIARRALAAPATPDVPAATHQALLDHAAYLTACLADICDYACDREDIDSNDQANDCMRIAEMVPYSVRKAYNEKCLAQARARQAAEAERAALGIRNITWTPE